MKKIGTVMTAAGMIYAFLLVSTDDFYTMELHQYHPLDWKGFLTAGILMAAGLLLHWIGKNFYIEIGRRDAHDRRRSDRRAHGNARTAGTAARR